MGELSTVREFQRPLVKVLSCHPKPKLKALSSAEVEALEALVSGLRIKEVAHMFGVTEGAIKQRVRNAKAKLGAKTTAQCVAFAAYRNIIRVPVPSNLG